ncbi:MAG: twin-arginine translocation signal domain-containing protein, partial [Bacteroidales bacterium]|nr:twin-arginine translocation signal domain-containing protein [Bacteroidales bacterium]
MSSTRRDFIKTASAIAAGTALPLEGFAIGRTKTAPNDRINVALIGGNGMGWSDLESFLKNP